MEISPRGRLTASGSDVVGGGAPVVDRVGGDVEWVRQLTATSSVVVASSEVV